MSQGRCHTDLGEVPFLRLAGRWLAQAGFQIGTSVCIKVDPGRLVIEAAPADYAADPSNE